MSEKAVRRYLESHAEPEAHAALEIEGSWNHVVVIPACEESIDVLGVLDESLEDVVDGARDESRGVLVVLVVNHAEGSLPECVAANARLLDELSARLRRSRVVAAAPPMTCGSIGKVDWLVVDRCSGAFALPEGQGVGLARKIGCDIALALHDAGRVRSRWIRTTDADVKMSRDGFHEPVGGSADADPVAAMIAPFRHDVDLRSREGSALAVYEVSLRYYVLGLEASRSPYAFHTIGSTLSIDASSYARVRGFPRRRAAEDFYLLNKLAKVGAVLTPSIGPLMIRQRESDRVPFGTGKATASISALGDIDAHKMYDARVFRGVARWMELLEAVATTGDANIAADALRAPQDGIVSDLARCLEVEEVVERSRAFVAQYGHAHSRRRQLHGWFDAFRTLKLIHRLRDTVYPSLPWREALGGAWFLAPRSAEIARATIDDALQAMAMIDESGLPSLRGVASSTGMTPGRASIPIRMDEPRRP